MVLLILAFLSFVFGILKLSSIIPGVWTECEASDFYVLLPSPVAVPILTSVRKTSWLCSLILTWNNSSQPIFSLMSIFFFSMHKNIYAFLNQLILWRWVNLQCCDCDRAGSVLGLAPFGRRLKTGASTLCSEKVQLLWPKHDSSIRLHNLPDELWQDYSQGGEFSYGCHTTSLSKLRRLWSLQDFGMLWWHCAHRLWLL